MDIIIICSSDFVNSDLSQTRFHDKSVLIISTDFIYEHEQRNLKPFFREVVCHTFNEYLTDGDLEECDVQVIGKCKDFKGNPTYYEEYVKYQKFYKNRKLFNNLSQLYPERKKYYYPSPLGISTEFFEQNGVESLFVKPPYTISGVLSDLKSYFYLVSKRLFLDPVKKLAAKKAIVYAEVYEYKGRYFLIVNGLKRIRNKYGELVFSGEIDLNDYKASLEKSLNIKVNECEIGVEVHQFSLNLAKIFSKLSLIVDHYIPSNYTYSYHDMYPSNCSFACLNKMDETFFKINDIPYNFLFDFLNSPLSGKDFVISSKKDTRNFTVVLLLGCASEWSAIISRSDNGKLLHVFVELAKTIPDANFIIRTHPTMNIVQHDGINSISRISDYLKFVNLNNVELSKSTLSEDVEKGNLFISEYSTTVFDGMSVGKIWLSCNVTGRRNYFEAFTKMGFLHAEDLEYLYRMTTLIRDNDEDTLGKFNLAKQLFRLIQ